jgi:hypothetical protein
MVDDDFRAGEALALEWLAGKTSLTDDLAVIVLGMARELSGEARDRGRRQRLPRYHWQRGEGIGQGQGAPDAGRNTSARIEAAAQPTPEPPQPQVDINELWRRRRERIREQRLDELLRRNQESWSEQAEMMRGIGAGGDWRGER